MTMLVQPRHTKLWLAAQQKNWQLAGFELNEMGGALKRVGQTVPKYRNISVDATVSSIFAPKIQAVAGAGQIGFTQSVADDPEVQKFLAEGKLPPEKLDFEMKWAKKTIPVYRIEVK